MECRCHLRRIVLCAFMFIGTASLSVEPHKPNTPRRPEGSPPLASLAIDCRNALIAAQVIEDVNSLDDNGSFYVPSNLPTRASVLVFSKEGKSGFKYSTGLISPSKVTNGTRSGVVELSNGSRVRVSASPWGDTTDVRLAKELDQEVLDAPSFELVELGWVNLSENSYQTAVVTPLLSLLNRSLAKPLTRGQGSVLNFLKKNKQKITGALEVCKVLATAIEREELNEYMKFIEEALSKLN